MSPEAEADAWRKTVKALDGLCAMADALMREPLILALGDALACSEESLRRAEMHECFGGGARNTGYGEDD
jgi:hypothetical protein